jgi:FKBP-type peptidyl-prolyl cis-trans isomerase SlyD
MSIEEGKVVLMHYTLKNDDGEELDSSDGQEPLGYLHGANNIVPGLEKELEGKSKGDSVSVTVPPEEGYGQRDEKGVQQVGRDQFPEDAPLEPGMQFVAQNADGSQFPFWVTAVKEDEVQIDMNHPLAGETLHFDVEIVNVRDASDEEKQHGHVHGTGGVEH